MDTAYHPAIEQLRQERAREIAGRAHVLALKRVEQLMRAMYRLADLGFVISGFEALEQQPITVLVDDPADELVDRVCGNGARGGHFSKAGSRLWISAEGVRVAWEVRPEPLPQPTRTAPDLDGLDHDPRN